MKKEILTMVMTFALAMSSCDKEVTLVFSSDDITVDLGGTNKELLKYVQSSDGSEVTVSGVNFDKVCSYQALFTSGDLKETRTVKVRADKLAGTYAWNMYGLERDGTYFRLTENEWYWDFTKGNEYNNLLIPDSVLSPYSNQKERLFGNAGVLTLQMDGDSISITPWCGKLLFMLSSKPIDYSFDSIRYGRLPNGDYGIISFRMIGKEGKYTNYYRFDFEKQGAE
jgi:hypothetical protein